MTITDDKLREIIAGCEGVTRGPWQQHLIDDTTVVSANGVEVCTTCDSINAEREDGYSIEYERMEQDASHIARLDPQTVKSMAEELLKLRAELPVMVSRNAEMAREAGKWKGRYEAAGYPGTLDGWIARAEKAEAENVRLSEELEIARMKLVACDVVALANTPESAANARAMHQDYWCPATQSVAGAVDREMALREALEPFARAADVKLCGEWRDDEYFGRTDVSSYLTFGDLRRASKALKGGK